MESHTFIEHETFLWIFLSILFGLLVLLLYFCTSIYKRIEEKGLLSKEEAEKLKQQKLEEEKLASEFKQFEKGLTENK